MKQIVVSLVLLFSVLLSTAQQNKLAAFTVTDYSSINNWASHPWKKDFGDSVPAPLRNTYNPDTSKADVFFIHPTTYTEDGRLFGWNAPVDNATLNQQTDEGTILFQATIFNEAGRLFAPRYQQAHIDAYFTIGGQGTQALNNAYEDVKAAFQYYLEHYNNGRPIIIASHSQGSTHSQRLVKEFFDGKPLQSKLVAAYIIGMDVNPNQYASIKECKTPTQSGCICSWRTYEKGFVPLYIKLENFNSIVTNPLTWDALKPDASKKANDGSIIVDFNTIIPSVADAQAKTKVLWISTSPFSDQIPTNDFHVLDLGLYYVDVRKNAKKRAEAFVQNTAIADIPGNIQKIAPTINTLMAEY